MPKEPTKEPTRTSSRLRGVPASISAPSEPKKRAAPKRKAAPRTSKKTEAEVTEPEDGEKVTEPEVEGAVEEEIMAEEPQKKNKLELGDVLPSLVLKNEKDEDVDICSLITEDQGLVIFTYPRADTPGCTKQACLYRDSKDEFAGLRYTVVGLSKDKPIAQQKWITKNKLNYHLLSDPTAQLITALGADNGNSTKRSHFIFEKGTGKLLEKALGVKPPTDSAKAQKFIEDHHA